MSTGGRAPSRLRRRSTTRVALFLWLVAWVLAAGPAYGQLPQPGQGVPPFREDVLLVAPQHAALRAALWADRGRYRPGEFLTLTLFLDRPARVLLLGVEPSGVVRLLLPNGLDGRVQLAAGTHRVPDASYRLQLTGPEGPYYVQLLAVLHELPVAWAQAVQREPFPVLAQDAAAFRRQLAQALNPSRSDWTAAWTSFWVGSGQAKDQDLHP